MNEHDFKLIEQRLGLSRREFLKFCTGVAATLGLAGMEMRFAEAVANPQRPVVIWLSGQECTGCPESLLRASHPTIEQLVLELISLEYSEVLSAAAGHQVEEHKSRILEEYKGKYLLVVSGSVPTKDGGIYCKIANKTMLEHVQEAAAGAAAVVAMGSCASWGGIPSSGPNPTGAVGVHKIVTGTPVVNIPGCPPNPYNFLATVMHFITFSALPELDNKLRPKFAYGRLIHEHCERRAHFDAGRFALEFGDEGHRQGWCLYKLGCKGPETYANCPTILFGDAGSGTWPVGCGHPCIGCTEEGVGFTKPIHTLARVKNLEPPTTYPGIDEPQGKGFTTGAGAVLAAVAGAAAGAGAIVARNLGKGSANTASGPEADKSTPAGS